MKEFMKMLPKYVLEITFLPVYLLTFCQGSILILWNIWKISVELDFLR